MRKLNLAWIVCVALCGAEEPDSVLVGMVRRAATSEQPALSLLESLGSHGSDLSLDKHDVWLALDELGNLDSLGASPEFASLVSSLEGIEVVGDSTKQVRVRLSEPLGLDLGAGYAHLGRAVAFDLTSDPASATLRLDGFEGFKLSKSKTAWIKVDLKSVTFDDEVARVDAGIGGVHEIRLAPESPPEPQVFAGEHPALTDLVSKALTSEGSPLGVFLAGLPQLASNPDEPLILEREAIEASVAQALADTGADPGRAREVGQRTFSELLEELGTLKVEPLEDGRQLVSMARRRVEGSTRIQPVSLGGNERWITFQRNSSFRVTPTAAGATYDHLYGLRFSKERYALRPVRDATLQVETREGTTHLVVEGGLERGDPDLAINTASPGPNRPREGFLKSLGNLVEAVDELSPQQRRGLTTLLRGR